MERGIRIGTSGWSYKHWKDRFYVAGVKPAEYLGYYAQHFNCAEINASFYRLPSIETVEKWTAIVPNDFRFCPKFSRYLTHIKRLREAEEPLQRFFTHFEPMLQKLGPILVQLPATLKFSADVAEPFFYLLANKYPTCSFVLEIRHGSWLENAALDLMAIYRIGLVISQSGVDFPYSEMVTSRVVYLRFHGPGALYASPYSEEMLQQFAQKMIKWKAEGHEVWAFFNNDIDGHAVDDARKLMLHVAVI